MAFAGRINGQEGRERRLENGKYERVNGDLGIRKEECWCKKTQQQLRCSLQVRYGVVTSGISA